MAKITTLRSSRRPEKSFMRAMYPVGIRLAFTSKTGGPCLKTDVGWATWSGFMVTTHRSIHWIYFRNHAPAERFSRLRTLLGKE